MDQIPHLITSICPVYNFCYDETKSIHGGTGFFINEKISFTKHEHLKISLDKNFESICIQVNLPTKGNLSAYVYIKIRIW